MERTAKEYEATLGEKEAFLVRGLSREGKGIFTITDASRLLGSAARRVVHRLAGKKGLPVK